MKAGDRVQIAMFERVVREMKRVVMSACLVERTLMLSLLSRHTGWILRGRLIMLCFASLCFEETGHSRLALVGSRRPSLQCICFSPLALPAAKCRLDGRFRRLTTYLARAPAQTPSAHIFTTLDTLGKSSMPTSLRLMLLQGALRIGILLPPGSMDAPTHRYTSIA